MSTYLEDVVSQVREWDEARPRTQQRELGWSGMADCRSYMGFVIAQDWPTEDEENWRAIAGTGLHEWLTLLRAEALYDVPGCKAEFGVEVSYGGVKGHADEVIWSAGEVTDYKFPRLASARVWDDADVLDEKFVQVHGYAAALVGTERWKDLAPRPNEATVRMLVMPVDGTFEDWKVYEQPFDREVADAALERYRFVREAVEAGERLPRDKPWFWCEKFCEFFTLCRGGSPEHQEFPEIHDAELAAAVERYGLAVEQGNEADRVKKEVSPLIRGLRGTARGWRVHMSRPGPGRLDYDDEAIAQVFQRSGLDVPMVSKPGSPSRLIVTREKR